MRKTIIAAAMLLVACASGGGQGVSGLSELLRRAGGAEADQRRDGNDYFVVDTVPGTRERSFNAVRYTYEKIGIPFSYYDADRYELGGFFARLEELDGEQPSTWVDCGHEVVAGNSADLSYINLTVATRVQALDSASSTIETVVRARSYARDVSSARTRCGTRGALEQRIADGALELLLRYGPSGGSHGPGR
jgi:hypothetical protein